MSDYNTFWQPLDANDIGEALSFFAYKDDQDDTRWFYKYAVQLRSTREYGGQGMAGDGDDFIIEEGEVTIPDRYLPDNEEEYLENFSSENAPAIPMDIEEEYHADCDLCDISEYMKNGCAFEEAYDAIIGIDEEHCEYLKKYASSHQWDLS